LEEGTDSQQEEGVKEETVLEKQVENSSVELLTLAHEGRELVCLDQSVHWYSKEHVTKFTNHI
jgi:hypothetical protein